MNGTGSTLCLKSLPYPIRRPKKGLISTNHCHPSWKVLETAGVYASRINRVKLPPFKGLLRMEKALEVKV